MIKMYIPQYKDMWFRKQLLEDPETMSYNNAWGGIIEFPESKWRLWYNNWIENPKKERFYRYLLDENDNFIGEIAYHLENNIYLANIIIYSNYRSRGYGREGLDLLCRQAKNNELRYLYDNIALDNPAIKLFLEHGFVEEYRTNEIIMLKKTLWYYNLVKILSIGK